MTSFFMPTNAELSLIVVMVFGGGYTHEFSFIWQIIQKSASDLFFSFVSHPSNPNFRVLVATIRDLGPCPCPRCAIPKVRFIELATMNDMEARESMARHDTQDRQQKVADARALIFNQGYAVNSVHIEALLKNESLVPTEVSHWFRYLLLLFLIRRISQNAFSKRLARFDFDIFEVLAADLMHEFEIGVWNALLLHLIRILPCQGPSAVHQFNARYVFSARSRNGLIIWL